MITPGSTAKAHYDFKATGPCPDHGDNHIATFEWTYESDSHTALSLISKSLRSGEFQAHCTCGFDFTYEHSTGGGARTDYYRTDTGELVPDRRPVGAMWYANWTYEKGRTGPDGLILQVRTPGGDWIIDSRASNCTRPDDNDHRCWVRHGTPPEITADKNGDTCAAGAGSIITGEGTPNQYHGFLRNGFLVDA